MTPDRAALRRALLAVQVLDDVDLQPLDNGVLLPGPPPLVIDEHECRTALAGDPGLPASRVRLSAWLRARRAAAELSPDELDDRLRPLGLPVGHVLHPGAGWVVERVLGGALDLGLGLLWPTGSGVDGRAGPGAATSDVGGFEVDTVGVARAGAGGPGLPAAQVVPLPPPAVAGTALASGARWARLRAELDELGALAADLVRVSRRGVLRPVADADVVTLLASPSLRRALAGDADGLATVVVPARRRGWTRLTLTDPLFGPAVAAATSPVERGFERPLLVTLDEVVHPPPGGRGVGVPLARQRAGS